MDFFVLDSTRHEEIKEKVIVDNKIKLYKSSFFKDYDLQDIQAFAVQNSLYQIPTSELIEFLKQWIVPGKTIEIGSGKGVIGKCLRIPCTDSHMQAEPHIKMFYNMFKQKPIVYPCHVEKLGALAAIEKYKPEVVIGSWITSPMDIDGNEGNSLGPDEEEILKKVDTYILIGNEKVHGRKIIRKYSHREYTADWLITRGRSQNLNRIYIWSKNFKELDLDYFKVSYQETSISK